jgi:hypothetical protein
MRGPSVVRLLSLPRGWTVGSIQAGDRNLADEPLEVRDGDTLDLRIAITNRSPAISGRVTDERGGAADGFVLLFPSDEARWFDAQALRSARGDQSGLFRLEAVRPGEYVAVALESVESSQAGDPEFLRSVRSRGTRVTVREGQPETLTLKVLR